MSISPFAEYVWKVIDSYADEKGYAAAQIESFNWFVRSLPWIIEERPTINLVANKDDGTQYSITFGELHITLPEIITPNRTTEMLTPAVARAMDLVYDAHMAIDITETTFKSNCGKNCKTGCEKHREIITTDVHRRQPLVRIPVMLHSCLCHLSTMSKEERIKAGECEMDLGGYFIFKGNEKVLVGQLRQMYNNIVVGPGKKELANKMKYVAEMRGYSDSTTHSVLLRAMITKNLKSVYFHLEKYIKDPIPAGIIFKALGLESPEDIRSVIGLSGKRAERLVQTIIRDSQRVATPDDAIAYIGRMATDKSADSQKRYARQIIDCEFLPHMGVASNNRERVLCLGAMIHRLLSTVLGDRVKDDIDEFTNKRLQDSGILMFNLIRNQYKKMLSSICKLYDDNGKSRPSKISTVMRGFSTKNTKDIDRCFSLGNWVVSAKYTIPGVSQTLTRLNYVSTVSHVRRIASPIAKETKSIELKALKSSQYGFVCPVETPEGAKAGAVLNLSYMAKISTEESSILVAEVINPLIVSIHDMELKWNTSYSQVYLNGSLLGITQDPESLVGKLRSYKGNRFSHQVSISFNPVEDEVQVFCDGGRPLRAVFTAGVDGLSVTVDSSSNFLELLDKGYITYIDPAEQEWAYIGMAWEDKGVDFYEIHPTLMMGVLGNIIPWPANSQSPRNCYQSNMGKQAMGVYMKNFRLRFDTHGFILASAQKPLVHTRYSDKLGVNSMPSGTNVMGGLLSYNGLNQEDSVIINRGAIDRGLFTAFSRKTVSMCEKKLDTNKSEAIMVPDPSEQNNNVNYSFLDDTGVIREGMRVKRGDVLVGKVRTNIEKTRDKNGNLVLKENKFDCSQFAKKGEDGIVERVVDLQAPSGFRSTKVVIRKRRRLRFGDKVASRAAQKGTVSIIDEADMPRTADGMVLDILINPHAIPSRMTINQLMETLAGKGALINGEYPDCTAWNSDVDVCGLIEEKMRGTGFNIHGWENVYSGMTGECLPAKVFVGPVYYQRLKHNVEDKVHARAQGGVTNLTRQPQEGRAKDGALRFGEMERDCMIAHGAVGFLREKLYKLSDPYTPIICENCGVFAVNPKKCNNCNSNSIVKVGTPYVVKLLQQEIQAVMIDMRLIPSK